MILKNIVLHALMFLWMGGTFARDNFPGLPMMDPLTGLLLIAGLVILVRKMDTLGRLIGCAFLLNLATGVLSNSQEGAPYVYRTAAVIVPGFLTAGLGLQWLAEKIGTRLLAVWCAMIIAVNLYLYFGLEAHNIAAMRVMAYEPKVIGLEIARGHQPVWLFAPDVLAQTERSPRAGERYPNANPAVVLPPIIRRLAIIEFSGRYDTGRPVLDNLGHPQDIYFLEPAGLETNSSFIVRPSKIIFKSDNQKILETVTRLGASIRYVPDILGEPFLTVADF